MFLSLSLFNFLQLTREGCIVIRANEDSSPQLTAVSWQKVSDAISSYVLLNHLHALSRRHADVSDSEHFWILIVEILFLFQIIKPRVQVAKQHLDGLVMCS